MTQQLNLSMILCIIVFIFAAIRILKKVIHIAILILPPLLFSTQSNLTFTTLFATWFILTDFIFNNYKDLHKFLAILISPSKTFKLGLISKTLNLFTRAFSIYLISASYIHLLNSLLHSQKIFSILNEAIYCFIGISVIKFITSVILKQSFIKQKKQS